METRAGSPFLYRWPSHSSHMPYLMSKLILPIACFEYGTGFLLPSSGGRQYLGDSVVGW